MTPSEVNALPQRVRDYIMNLETRCDPNGEIRELFYLREQNAQLIRLIKELKEESCSAATTPAAPSAPGRGG